MSSASPPSSQSPPQNASKGRPESAASDANIRNFAPVARIMKMALPENAKIAKEAKECMQECVSEFISFITSEGASREPPVDGSFLTAASLRKVPAGEAQDGQWRGHPLCHDLAWLRELRRSLENLFVALPRSKLPPSLPPPFRLLPILFWHMTKNNLNYWY